MVYYVIICGDIFQFLEEISDPSDKSRDGEKRNGIKEGVLTEYRLSSFPGNIQFIRICLLLMDVTEAEGRY